MLLIEKGVHIFRRWNNFSAVAYPTGFVCSQCQDQGVLVIIRYPAENDGLQNCVLATLKSRDVGGKIIRWRLC